MIEVEEWQVRNPKCRCVCTCGAGPLPRERHVFLEGDSRGQAYVIGYDPEKIPEDALRRFLAEHGIALP